MPGIVEEEFRLYQDDPVVSVTTTGVASTWTDMWKYQVPIGVSLVIKPHHTFCAYINDGAEVGSNTCSIKVEKRDASESSVEILLGPCLYARVREFQDDAKKARFKVRSEGVVIGEREYLVIACYDDGTITEANCYWEARIAKVRKAIGG